MKAQRILILSLLIFQIGFAPTAQAADTADSLALLDGLLTSPLPTHRGMTKFFEQEHDFEMPEHVEHAQTDSEIKGNRVFEAAEKGHDFAKIYFQFFKDDFAPSLVPFILNPERASITLLSSLLSPRFQNNERPLSESDARRLAWQEMTAQFGIDPNISPGEYQTRVSRESRYLDANRFYAARYYRLLQQDRIQKSPESNTVEEAKTKLKKQITDLRILNFQAAIKRASSYKNLNFKIARADGTQVSYSDEIAKAQIYFKSGFAYSAPDHVITPKSSFFNLTRGILKSWGLRKSSKDFDEAQQFYKVPESNLATPQYGVEFQFANGTKFILREDHWHNLLKILLPQDSEVIGQTHSWENRYLIEAARRDAMLADLDVFVGENSDLTIEGLIQRLETRIGKIQGDGSTKLLQDEIRLFDDTDAETLSSIDAIRWYGYSVHPAFWRLRSYVAHKMMLTDSPLVRNDVKTAPASSSGTTTPRSRADQKQIKKSVKKELTLKPYRTLSTAKRIRSRVIRTAAFFIAMTVLENLVFPPPADAGDFNVHKYIHNLGKEFIGSHLRDALNKMIPSGHGSDGINAVRLAHKQDLENVSRSEKGTAAKVEVFRLQSYTDPKLIPEHFLAVQFENLPSAPESFETSLDRNNLSEHGLEKVELNETVKSQNPVSDFQLSMQSPSVADAGLIPIIPIVTPDGFKLTWLRIRGKYGDDLKAETDYKIFRILKNGLYYVQFNPKHYSGASFFYRAQYQKDSVNHADPDFFRPLTRSSLISEVRHLAETGAYDLPQSLRKLLLSKKDVTLVDIQDTLAGTGKYTWSKSSGKDDKNSSDAFSKYKKFLVDGDYYWQCFAANRFLVDFLNDYFDGRSLHAEIVGGFRRAPGQMRVFADAAHATTMVSNMNRPNAYIHLDGTPLNLDPKDIRAPQKPNEPGKAPPLSAWGEYIVPVKREKFRIAADTDNTSDNEQNENHETDASILNTEMTTQLETLQRYRDAASTKLVLALEKSKNFAKTPTLYKNPLTKGLDLAQALARQLEKQAPAHDMLLSALAVELGTPPTIESEAFLQHETDEYIKVHRDAAHALKRLLQKNQIEAQDFLNRIKTKAAEGTLTGYEIFLDEDLSLSLQSLNIYLEKTTWVKKAIAMPKDFGSCVKALTITGPVTHEI